MVTELGGGGRRLWGPGAGAPGRLSRLLKAGSRTKLAAGRYWGDGASALLRHPWPRGGGGAPGRRAPKQASARCHRSLKRATVAKLAGPC